MHLYDYFKVNNELVQAFKNANWILSKWQHKWNNKKMHKKNNNTNYDIFPKILLPETLHYEILFPFIFIHNNNYFFYKKFGLYQNERIILYNFNKDEKKDENDYAIHGKSFIEDKKIDLEYEFMVCSKK